MKNTTITIIILAVIYISFNKIEFLRNIKLNARAFLLGTEVQTTEVQEDSSVDRTTSPGPTSEKITTMSKRTKILNILREFINGPSPEIKDFLISELNENISEFKESDYRDDELVSLLQRLIPHFQDSDLHALDLTFKWYAHLEGSNKREAGILLGQGLDYMPEDFLQLYSRNYSEISCEFASLVPVSVVEGEDRKIFLQERREKLKQAQRNLAHLGGIQAYADRCMQVISREL